MLLSTGLYYCPQSYVIIHVVVLWDPWHCPQSYVISTWVCYCPQSYVIVHVILQTHVIVHRAMLLSTWVCYCPYCGILRLMLSSTELCYCPQRYVVVHRPMLSSMWLLSTELLYCMLSPQGYAKVHRAMLSSMWWFSQTHVIVHIAMLSSTGVCYGPYCGILILMQS